MIEDIDMFDLAFTIFNTLISTDKVGEHSYEDLAIEAYKAANDFYAVTERFKETEEKEVKNICLDS